MDGVYKVAGIDVHKKMLAVVITNVAELGEYRFERRKFGTGESELKALADCLTGEGVAEVVMESTAQYWKEALNSNWRKLNRTGHRRGASRTLPTPNGWCVGWLPGN